MQLVGPPVTVTPRVVLQQEDSVHVAFTHISSHAYSYITVEE